MNGEGFRTKLQALINEHSMENGSNTPDFILAKYLAKCLTNFDESVVARDTWYGKSATGTAMVDFERNPPEARPINPTSPSYEAGEVEGFTSGKNNPIADLSVASLRERALVAWGAGAARRLTASFGSRATAPIHVERRRDEFVEGYVYGFARGARQNPAPEPVMGGGGGGAGGNACEGGVGGDGQPLGYAGGAGGNGGGGAGAGSRTEGTLEVPAWLFKSKGMLEAPAWLLKSAIGFLLSLQASGDVRADDELQHRLVAARSLGADPADFIEWASERDRVFTRWRIEHGVEAGDVAASKRAFDALAKKLEPGDVAAAKGALDALSAARSVFPLRDDEERDWRMFAFAKTREGSVWERTAVQRLFATIDAQRGKWQEYEREYILPCFQWARELGFDLERMVIDNPGHNCVELLVSTLRKRLAPEPDAADSVQEAGR